MFLSPQSLFQLGSGLVSTFTNSGTKMPPPQPNPYRSGLNDSMWAFQAENNALRLKQSQQQSDLALAEGTRDAAEIGREAKTAISQQAHQYNNSGVRLEGTPMQVMELSRRLAQQQVDALTQRSIAVANILRENGLVQNNEANAALLGQRTSNAFAAGQFDAQQALSRISDYPQYSKAADVLRSLSNILPGYSGPGARKPPSSPMPPLAPSFPRFPVGSGSGNTSGSGAAPGSQPFKPTGSDMAKLFQEDDNTPAADTFQPLSEEPPLTLDELLNEDNHKF